MVFKNALLIFQSFGLIYHQTRFHLMNFYLLISLKFKFDKNLIKQSCSTQVLLIRDTKFFH